MESPGMAEALLNNLRVCSARLSPGELIRRQSENFFADELGGLSPIVLLPGLSADELDEFAASIPKPLPEDLRQLLRFCRGFTCRGILGARSEKVSFVSTPIVHPLLPQALVLAENDQSLWLVDLDSTNPTWGPIYWMSHSPPALLFHSESLSGFLTEFFKPIEAHSRHLPNESYTHFVGIALAAMPGTPAPEARRREDPDLAAFASNLADDFEIYDLRGAAAGDGFDWDHLGPQARLRRAAHLPLFAAAPQSLRGSAASWRLPLAAAVVLILCSSLPTWELPLLLLLPLLAVMLTFRHVGKAPLAAPASRPLGGGSL